MVEGQATTAVDGVGSVLRARELLLLLMSGQDMATVGAALDEAGIEYRAAADVQDLCRRIEEGAGAALVAEETLDHPALDRLVETLAQQPPWSDLPLLILGRGGEAAYLSWETLEGLQRVGSAALLERPLSSLALLSAVEVALRARRRQYELRQYFVELRRRDETLHSTLSELKTAQKDLKSLNETLEQRIAQRTDQLQRQAEELRALATLLAQTEQRERRRLAQVLHDHLQQLLVAARIKVGLLRRGSAASLDDQRIEQIESLLGQAVEASRSLCVELSPPLISQAGLSAALRWLAGQMTEKHGLRVEVEAASDDDPADEEVAGLLFQAARELLFNVVKHAETGSAALRLARPAPGWIELRVSDAGRGFDRAADRATGFGLFALRQRLKALGGRLEIDSAPGRGAAICLALPAP